MKVLGVSGLIIANKKEDTQMKTYITYNKGQTWSLLQPPTKDATGNDINCNLVRTTTYQSFDYNVAKSIYTNTKCKMLIIIFIQLMLLIETTHFVLYLILTRPSSITVSQI